jgi:hypothetical protein
MATPDQYEKHTRIWSGDFFQVMVVQWVTSGPSHRTILRNRIQQQHLWPDCWWQCGPFSRLEAPWAVWLRMFNRIHTMSPREYVSALKESESLEPGNVLAAFMWDLVPKMWGMTMCRDAEHGKFSQRCPMGQRVSKCASFQASICRFERRALVPGLAPVLPFGHWKGGSWWIGRIWRDHLDVSSIFIPCPWTYGPPMDSKWCRSLWLHLAAGISESWDTFRICHFLVPPRAEHPGQKPICQTTCPQFIVFTIFFTLIWTRADI